LEKKIIPHHEEPLNSLDGGKSVTPIGVRYDIAIEGRREEAAFNFAFMVSELCRMLTMFANQKRVKLN